MRSMLRLALCAIAVGIMAPHAMAQSDTSPPELTAARAKAFLTAAGLQTCEITDIDPMVSQVHGATKSLSIGVAKDCARYDPFSTPLNIPIQIFQGRRDEAVSPDMVQRFAAARSNVELHLLDDDHQLTSSLPYIWQHSARFLGIAS